MTSNNVQFVDKDVAGDDAARKEMMAKTGGKLAVPVVDIDGEIKVGYDEAWIKTKLDLK